MAYAKRLLSNLAEQFDMPELAEFAMRPGGVRIKNYPFRRGDRAYPIVLNDAGFSGVGLNMAWLTPPINKPIRGSHLTHAGLSVHLHVRSNPTRSDCKLITSIQGPCPEMDRTAIALIRLAPLLGVRGVMSAHEEIKCSRALRIACYAKSVSDLESALVET